VARWEALTEQREQVRALLSEGEWAAARRNTLNAHYTGGELVQAVWDTMTAFGFDGGRVLEPGSGSGNFIGFAPQDTLLPVQMMGVEVEPTTAAISRYLYPDAEIISTGLEKVELPDGTVDAVVGNVPFGRYARFDSVHNPDLSLSIHDHFILKSLAATRPGGVVALITSRFTLDADDPSARQRMYELGDLVGAVRLPARSHAAAAGTDVVTDVLFLRRRVAGEEPGDDRWLTSTPTVLAGHDEPLRVNDYFTQAHPEHVLGTLQARSGQFGPEPTVVGTAADIAAELAQVGTEIAESARAAGRGQRSAAAAIGEAAGRLMLAGGAAEGSLDLDPDGAPVIVDGGRWVPVDVHPEQRDKLVQLIVLKRQVLALYAAEDAATQAGETPELAKMRSELRMMYLQGYRRNNPPLSKPRQTLRFTPKEAKERAAAEGLKTVPEEWKARTAYAWIDDDPDASLLFGLEEWDERTGTAIEQKVLRTRVLEPRQLPTRADDPESAIALAMEWDGGRLDLARVASLLGVDQDTAAEQIAAYAFRDPGQGGQWEPRHRYLSGNVRTKLEQAQEAALSDPSYTANVAGLQRVQPTDLAPSEIRAKIGAPWIPTSDYTDFLHHLGFEDAEVVHAGGTVWEVRGARYGDLARTEWGTPERGAGDLFAALLRQTDSTIRVVEYDSDGKAHTNPEATEAAREKAKLIANAFDDWIWADTERAERLAADYNARFNNLVMPEYDTARLTLPGIIGDWEMRPHQNAAIRRILAEPTALLAHVVGAGKTATMVAGAMELRRTGMAQKPALVIPNHMLKQITREFKQLYPNAKLLAITASDLSKGRRAKFMARAAGGEWDAVILTHEAFKRVPLRPEKQQAYLDAEMANLREQLDAASAAGMEERTVKQIENTIANAEAHMQQQIAQASEAGVYLEDTGIDYLFMDESHEFKNLRTVSAIPGAAIEGSAKATKLHMVLEYLRSNSTSGRVATLATGTPIANSVTEAYVLMRYLAPELLAEQGLDAFDNWAATFGEVVSQLEPDPKGNGYRYKARFSRFFNVPELMAAYRSFADVQMAQDLNLPTPPVRANADGGRGETIVIAPTPAQRDFIKALSQQPWVNRPGGVLKALGEGLRGSLDMNLVVADPTTGEPTVDWTKVAEVEAAAATDMRMVGGSASDGSKLPDVAAKVAEIWRQTKDLTYPTSKDDPTPQELPGGLQLVFLDEGTPGSTAKHGANLYADLRDQLAEYGIPREEIRFIHEAGTDAKKAKLFADARAGRVKVLIGSTQKMGTGTNIQDRAVALHHVSYPWRPADMEQRDGRVERQGNFNAPWIEGTPDDVRILYYVTERTFDEFRLNSLARKARFIAQIQRREFNLREIEDIGEVALNLGMLTALASGDPAILQHAEATGERVRLQGLARSWDREQDNRRFQMADLTGWVARADNALEEMRAAAPLRRPTTGDAFATTVDGRRYTKYNDAGDALGTRLVAIARDQSLPPGQRIPVGQLGGLDFHAEVSFDHNGRRQVKLRFWDHVLPPGQREDRAQWHANTLTESNGRGALQALQTFLNRLDDDTAKLEAAVTRERARLDQLLANVRPKDQNPYREQARSKEREEGLLGRLIIANEKVTDQADRVGDDVYASDDAKAELEDLRDAAASLRAAIEAEHAIQQAAEERARAERRGDATSTTGTAAAEPEDVDQVPEPPAEEQLDLFGAPEPDVSDGADETATAVPAVQPEPATAPPTEQPPAPTLPTEQPAVDDSPDTVITPNGPGRIIGSDDGNLVLVTTESGARVWSRSEVHLPGETAPLSDSDDDPKVRRNAEDEAQAATHEGIELGAYTGGNRLRDLDTEAGTGTIIDSTGEVIGWVRARTGDDGRRYWWAQDAAGGPPEDPFHEGLPASAVVPAIRAAGHVRPTYRTEDRPRRPISADRAAQEIRLTSAQARELSQLTLPADVDTPPWEPTHRRYVLTTTQMRALADAAWSAAATTGTATPGQRRRQQVLFHVVERLDAERYDTARRYATIPPLDQPDPYALPYERVERTLPAPPPEVPPAAEPPAAELLPDDVDQEVPAAAEPVMEEPPAAVVEPEPAAADDVEFDPNRREDQEQYARTGRVPSGYDSVEDWLGDGATEARALREDYLEAQIEDAEAVPQEGERTSMTTPLDKEPDAPSPAPLAPQTPELPPLWTDDAPRGSGGSGEPQETAPQPAAPDSGPPEDELWDGFDQMLQAWADHVPAEQGTAEDLRTTLAEDLQALDRAGRPDNDRWDRVAGARSEPPSESAPAPTEDAAAALSTAVAAADSHADRLRDLPEWQQLQTVRGAAKHLFDTLQKRAGERWNDFWNDSRVQGFWRTVSIRTAEAISRLATWAADKLHAGAAADRPAAEAVSEVSRAAAAYVTSARGPATPTDPPADSRGGAPSTGAVREDTPQQVQAGTAAADPPVEEAKADQPQAATPPATLGTPDTAPAAPKQVQQAQPYGSRGDAVRASQGVAASFKSWIDTPMGQELAQSTNPHVMAFREAWQRLPTADLPTGPGPAAGPYGEVAVKARALVEAAVASGRFTRVDVTTLRALSTEASSHAGRLAVTLPGTQSGTPAAAAAAPAVAAPRPQVPAPAPPAARGPRAGA
jgi:N12 class adenine-specific DNA methylase